MNKIAQHYPQLLSTLTRRLEAGERDIDQLVAEAQEALHARGELTHTEITQITQAVKRDLEEFARNYNDASEDGVFLRVIQQSIWKELADITDRTRLEWQGVFQDLNHHGVYQSGEVVGLGNLVCEKCHFTRGIYTPETLNRCPECGHDQFQRQPFDP